MKNMVGGRGAPMWGMGWSGFAVVMIAALCIGVIEVFRPHARANDGKIMTYGLNTAMTAPSGADAGKTAAAEAARTRGM